MSAAAEKKFQKSEGRPDRETPILQLDGVSKRFTQKKRRIQALDAVSIRLQQGKITGLIGPDGAGKTTLMRLCACLLKPDAGRIIIDGVDAAKDPMAVRHRISYMPQQFGLYRDLSVQENLDLYSDLQGIDKVKRRKRYRDLMKMTNLEPFRSRLAGRLSGGMKQKLALACALLRSPRLLLLDEPTVGVDPVSRRELWRIVSRLVRDEGISVFLSTAYLDETERCHEIILLHDGSVLVRGSPERFSRKMAGRTYIVTGDLKKRRLQEKLARQADLIDAVIQAGGVRVVTKEKKRPDLKHLHPEAVDLRVEAVPPRFEDRYAALLNRGRDRKTVSIAPSSTNTDPDAVVIDVRHVKRRFGDFYAVKDVTFDVTSGEVFGLLGANGAGKTTTFRMLCGLLPVSGGDLTVAGLNLRKAAAEARARIGYMSQHFSLYGNLTVRQNLQFFSSAYDLSGAHRQNRIRWALEQFDLGAFSDNAGALLSLGYKQRLSLACALMHEPEILFLDEPTSGVDPMARRKFWSHINSLANKWVTVLVTTHFMAEAEYCDRLAIMAAGEILALGTPAEIRNQASRNSDHPVETMEDAFVALMENQ